MLIITIITLVIVGVIISYYNYNNCWGYIIYCNCYNSYVTCKYKQYKVKFLEKIENI